MEGGGHVRTFEVCVPIHRHATDYTKSVFGGWTHFVTEIRSTCHVPINPNHFMAYTWSFSFAAFVGKPMIGISSNLVEGLF